MTPALIDEAGRQLRAPWAAAVAGLLFAALFTAALLLLRSQALIGASDDELVRIFASGQDLPGVIGGLYLAPFAGIMFLWFVAVIRDQVGDREDRFFATVFLGSGLIFVATLFAAPPSPAPRWWVLATWASRHPLRQRSRAHGSSPTRCSSPSPRAPVRSSCW